MRSTSIAVLLVSLPLLTACETEPPRSTAPVAGESADTPDGSRTNPFAGRGTVQEVEAGDDVVFEIEMLDDGGYRISKVSAGAGTP